MLRQMRKLVKGALPLTTTRPWLIRYSSALAASASNSTACHALPASSPPLGQRHWARAGAAARQASRGRQASTSRWSKGRDQLKADHGKSHACRPLNSPTAWHEILGRRAVVGLLDNISVAVPGRRGVRRSHALARGSRLRPSGAFPGHDHAPAGPAPLRSHPRGAGSWKRRNRDPHRPYR